MPYPALRNLRERVDFLIHIKVGLTEWEGPNLAPRLLELLELVKPRFMIPIHYRTDRISDPVPEGHWPPNITDVMAFTEWIRETVGDRTKVLPFTAGIQYELDMPAKSVLWKWNWHKMWTVQSRLEG